MMNQGRNNNSHDNVDKGEHSQSVREKRLQLELERKDEEINKLKKLLSEQDAQIPQGGTISSQLLPLSRRSVSKEQTYDANNLSKKIGDEKRDTFILKSYKKEITFQAQGKADIDKPRNGDVVQMHYHIEVYHCSSSTSQGKMELLGKQSDGRSISNLIHKEVIMKEDSRTRRNGQSFEFILGEQGCNNDDDVDQQQQQVTNCWEEIIRGMYRGEVALITMNFDSIHELGVLSLYPDENIILDKLDSIEDVNTIGYEVKCRVELINFWTYKRPHRPWIIIEH